MGGAMDDFSKLSVEELTTLLANGIEFGAVIQNISSKEQLELAGELLTADQILKLFSDKQLKEKISPILVGMDQDKFEELLLKSSDKQMEVLKSEVYSEALTHHLTLLIHRLEEENLTLFKSLSAIEGAIQGLDPEITSKEAIEALRQQIDAGSDNVHHAREKVKKAMVLVWSSSDIELIDKLNKANSALMRMSAPSELHALLNQKLFSVYRGLKDDDSAIDGLANFSVWYVEDYIDVGLILPTTHQKRETLFQQTRDRLNELNLCTIKDLKEALIFSRQTLKEYISSWNA